MPGLFAFINESPIVDFYKADTEKYLSTHDLKKILEPEPKPEPVHWLKSIHHTMDENVVYFHFDPAELMAMEKERREHARMETEMSQAARLLPGVDEVVSCPFSCDMAMMFMPAQPTAPLGGVIMHLNDYHRWPREAIADWLDELADAGVINIDFPTPE